MAEILKSNSLPNEHLESSCGHPKIISCWSQDLLSISWGWVDHSASNGIVGVEIWKIWEKCEKCKQSKKSIVIPPSGHSWMPLGSIPSHPDAYRSLLILVILGWLWWWLSISVLWGWFGWWLVIPVIWGWFGLWFADFVLLGLIRVVIFVIRNWFG